MTLHYVTELVNLRRSKHVLVADGKLRKPQLALIVDIQIRCSRVIEVVEDPLLDLVDDKSDAKEYEERPDETADGGPRLVDGSADADDRHLLGEHEEASPYHMVLLFRRHRSIDREVLG